MNIENLTFGVEIETTIPIAARINVGAYHRGAPLAGVARDANDTPIMIPNCNGRCWKAELDGSIHVNSRGYQACEFVSPILQGEAGILAGLRAIEQRDALDQIFGLSQIQPQRGRCILNFHGDPGTGKTRAAMAIALRLGKPVYQVDYSAVISKYLGDTAKHIKYAFERARAHGAILFFDEADSLLSRRVDMGESCATSINQNRNVLMQELDRFDGVVIMTTNLFGNYDPALLRRIARHIEFRLPGPADRQKLFELHLPTLAAPERVAHYGPIDLGEIARASDGLSGGDILNVCTNAIHAASTSENVADWQLTQALLLAEVRKVKTSKQAHGGHRASGAIGFRADDRDLEQ